MTTWTPNTVGTVGSFDFSTTQSAGYNFKGSNPVIGNQVDSISLYLKMTGGITGTLKCAIWDASGVLKSTSTDTIDISTISGDYSDQTFQNFPSYEIASTDYIAIYSDDMSGAGVIVKADTSSPDSGDYVGCRQTTGNAFSEFTRYASTTSIDYSPAGPPPPASGTTTIPPPIAMVRL